MFEKISFRRAEGEGVMYIASCTFNEKLYRSKKTSIAPFTSSTQLKKCFSQQDYNELTNTIVVIYSLPIYNQTIQFKLFAVKVDVETRLQKHNREIESLRKRVSMMESVVMATPIIIKKESPPKDEKVSNLYGFLHIMKEVVSLSTEEKYDGIFEQTLLDMQSSGRAANVNREQFYSLYASFCEQEGRRESDRLSFDKLWRYSTKHFTKNVGPGKKVSFDLSSIKL